MTASWESRLIRMTERDLVHILLETLAECSTDDVPDADGCADPIGVEHVGAFVEHASADPDKTVNGVTVTTWDGREFRITVAQTGGERTP